MNETNVMISNDEGIRLNSVWEWVKGRIHASVYAQLGGCTAGHDMKEGHIDGRSLGASLYYSMCELRSDT